MPQRGGGWWGQPHSHAGQGPGWSRLEQAAVSAGRQENRPPLQTLARGQLFWETQVTNTGE